MKFNLFKCRKNQEKKAKRQLIQALHRRDTVALENLIVRWQNIIGEEKLTHLIVNEVLLECNAESHSWFFESYLGAFRYRQLQQQAQNNVFQILVNASLQPGKDFSFGLDGEMIVSDRAKQILLNHLPKQQQKFFEAQLQFSTVADPIAAIETNLGCQFYQNLTKIAAQKVHSLNDAQAAAYLGILVAGLVQRHPILKDVDFPTKFIFDSLQDLPQQRVIAILNDQETNPQFDQVIIFQDLLAAMEETESVYLNETERCYSLEQLKKLNLVWCVEDLLAEIMASLKDL